MSIQMNNDQIDEALNEAYKKGWEDAFTLFKRHYYLVKGIAEPLKEDK